MIRDAQPFDPRLDAFIAEQADGTDRSKLGRELDRFEHERGGDRLKERDRSGRARRKAWFAKLDGLRRLPNGRYRPLPPTTTLTGRRPPPVGRITTSTHVRVGAVAGVPAAPRATLVASCPGTAT